MPCHRNNDFGIYIFRCQAFRALKDIKDHLVYLILEMGPETPSDIPKAIKSINLHSGSQPLLSAGLRTRAVPRVPRQSRRPDPAHPEPPLPSSICHQAQASGSHLVSPLCRKKKAYLLPMIRVHYHGQDAALSFISFSLGSKSLKWLRCQPKLILQLESFCFHSETIFPLENRASSIMQVPEMQEWEAWSIRTDHWEWWAAAPLLLLYIWSWAHVLEQQKCSTT